MGERLVGSMPWLAAGALATVFGLACSSDDGGEGAASGGAVGAGGATSGMGGSSAGSSASSNGGATSGGSSAGGSPSGGASGNASGGATPSGGSPSAGGGNGGAPSAGADPGSGGSADAGEGSGGAPGTGGAAGGEDSGGSAGTTGGPVEFEKITLTEDFYSEGAAVGDINADGVLDLVTGPLWYAGPDFDLGGQLYDAQPVASTNNYSIFFLTYVGDINGDTFPDVIQIGDAGGGNGTNTPNSHWYQNPGPENLDQEWEKFVLYGTVQNESPAYVNLLGDATPMLVFMSGPSPNNPGSGPLGYAVPGNDPTAPWTFTEIGGSFTTYTHGLGVGDIDGDGRMDVTERTGWWRQLPGGGWEKNTVDFGDGADKSRSNWGGSEMQIYDVDGDGDSDVVTALAAHQYGLSWFEQEDDGSFTTHSILPAMAAANNFSQLHAMASADVNGDGLRDVITGKRHYAHPASNAASADPENGEAPVLYWFELSRDGGEATFTPHLIDDDSGVGCVFVAQDLNGDDKVDIFTSNKRGTFLFLQR